MNNPIKGGFYMNNRVFPNFNNNFEPEYDSCPVCELVDSYLPEIIHVNDHEELEALLHNLVEEAFHEGYTSSLKDDIEFKADLLNENGIRGEFNGL